MRPGDAVAAPPRAALPCCGCLRARTAGARGGKHWAPRHRRFPRPPAPEEPAPQPRGAQPLAAETEADGVTEEGTSVAQPSAPLAQPPSSPPRSFSAAPSSAGAAAREAALAAAAAAAAAGPDGKRGRGAGALIVNAPPASAPYTRPAAPAPASARISRRRSPPLRSAVPDVESSTQAAQSSAAPSQLAGTAQQLRVSSSELPAVAGVYELLAQEHNKHPQWAFDRYRLCRSTRGNWVVADVDVVATGAGVLCTTRPSRTPEGQRWRCYLPHTVGSSGSVGGWILGTGTSVARVADLGCEDGPQWSPSHATRALRAPAPARSSAAPPSEPPSAVLLQQVATSATVTSAVVAPAAARTDLRSDDAEPPARSAAREAHIQTLQGSLRSLGERLRQADAERARLRERCAQLERELGAARGAGGGRQQQQQQQQQPGAAAAELRALRSERAAIKEVRRQFEVEQLEMNSLRLQWASERDDMEEQARVLRESVAQARRDLADAAFPPRLQLAGSLWPDPSDEEARVDALIGRRRALEQEINSLEDRLGALRGEVLLAPQPQRPKRKGRVEGGPSWTLCSRGSSSSRSDCSALAEEGAFVGSGALSGGGQRREAAQKEAAAGSPRAPQLAEAQAEASAARAECASLRAELEAARRGRCGGAAEAAARAEAVSWREYRDTTRRLRDDLAAAAAREAYLKWQLTHHPDLDHDDVPPLPPPPPSPPAPSAMQRKLDDLLYCNASLLEQLRSRDDADTALERDRDAALRERDAALAALQRERLAAAQRVLDARAADAGDTDSLLSLHAAQPRHSGAGPAHLQPQQVCSHEKAPGRVTL